MRAESKKRAPKSAAKSAKRGVLTSDFNAGKRTLIQDEFSKLLFTYFRI